MLPLSYFRYSFTFEISKYILPLLSIHSLPTLYPFIEDNKITFLKKLLDHFPAQLAESKVKFLVPNYLRSFIIMSYLTFVVSVPTNQLYKSFTLNKQTNRTSKYSLYPPSCVSSLIFPLKLMSFCCKIIRPVLPHTLNYNSYMKSFLISQMLAIPLLF